MTKVSPLAPERFPGMPPVAGVALAADRLKSGRASSD